ncbi:MULTISPECIES: L,D-transpeptidase family protein [Actinomadura]|uniref:Peptidoglycan-binding protein n=1 Tax=Actinomadura yumaensis TaxID=111807 RepID=A0ABW2CC61_9ACTN|nr:L,D-transpeptidase family protein [Actinomadura sp. J1-007]MWK33699.1 L,D-transpeptidase family protein [Actinomadura sp. J1-007]
MIVGFALAATGLLATAAPPLTAPPPPSAHGTATAHAVTAVRGGAAGVRAIRPGDRGPAVRALQKRLRTLRYDPGPANGSYGETTRAAVWAFQKVNRMRPTGIVGKRERAALKHPRAPRRLVRHRARNRVEIDLRRQVLVVYRKGRVALITHISTGSGRRYCHRGRCGIARTPRGDFRVTRRVRGWRHSPLGYMYRPLYFHNGYAMHGSVKVPLRPVSHGCVRIPMHTADIVPRLVRNRTPVHVRR